MTHSLFVYGTLKRGASNEGRRLLRGAEFVSRVSTTGSLYDLGRYPGLVRRPASKDRVFGELYRLPDDSGDRILRELDVYEGNEFVRRRVYVMLPNGRRRLAWAYILRRRPPHAARHVHSGRYPSRRRVA
jgi:gamma-glutamylcyclotransferase (GGCT)/AIG2-like uncharacterized protein YtfP